MVGLISPRGAVGGSFGSWITKEAFDKYTNGIVDDIKANGPFDGIYLSLHGAMAVTDVPKPEAEIARRVRAAVGPDVPIVATFDPHGNEDHEFLEVADGAFCVKRYPHYDSRFQGERAARYMVRMIRGDYKPTTATRKPGVITPSVFQGTGVSPAKDIMERARRWENREADAYVSVFFGFAYADVPDAGATVEVMTNNDQALADKIADDMAEYIWRVRKEFAGKKLPKTKEGVALDSLQPLKRAERRWSSPITPTEAAARRKYSRSSSAKEPATSASRPSRIKRLSTTSQKTPKSVTRSR